MRKHIVIIFFALFCICSFLGGVHFNNFINNWDLLILTFGLLGFYLCLLENRITKELFLILSLIILVPLIFFSGLSLIDSTLVSSINDWIGFLGAYFGIVGAIGGIWWQLKQEKIKIQLGSLKIFNYYFNLILGTYDGSLNSNIPLKKKFDNFHIFLNIRQGTIAEFSILILSNTHLSTLREEFKNISSLNISHKILEILDYIEHTNLLISEITSNSFGLSEKIKKIEKYILHKFKASNNSAEYQQDIVMKEFQNALKELDKISLNNENISLNLTSVINNFYSLYHKFENNKIMFFIIIDCIKYLSSIEEVLYKPGLNIFESEIKKIIPEIEQEIKKLS